jgi:anti-sigma factor RsiW
MRATRRNPHVAARTARPEAIGGTKREPHAAPCPSRSEGSPIKGPRNATGAAASLRAGRRISPRSALRRLSLATAALVGAGAILFSPMPVDAATTAPLASSQGAFVNQTHGLCLDAAAQTNGSKAAGSSCGPVSPTT